MKQKIKGVPTDVSTIDFPPFEIHIDPGANVLYERWWHKFMFWRKFRYPRWPIKIKYIKDETK
jgi:hypothetical protein